MLFQHNSAGSYGGGLALQSGTYGLQVGVGVGVGVVELYKSSVSFYNDSLPQILYF
jgi:hypothetical protein